MKGFRIVKRIGAERDWEPDGKEGTCRDCGQDFLDEEKAVWSRKPDMTPNLDGGIAGFTLAHTRCKVCERKI